MKISLITVAYNSSKTIIETMQSVLAQSYPFIEYVVVDGFSQDNTIELVKEFESKFNGRLHWISEPDNGLYDAMNKGIQLASGDVVGIINSDDLFYDQYAIEKVMRILNAHETLDSVYADLFYVSQTDTSKIIRRWTTGEKKPFKFGWHPAHPTFFIKRKIFDKFGLFNLNFKLAADFEIMLRFLEKYHISTYYLHDSLVKMRLGGATNKNIKNIYIQNIECIKAFKLNGIKVNPVLYPLFRLLPKLLQFKRNEFTTIYWSDRFSR